MKILIQKVILFDQHYRSYVIGCYCRWFIKQVEFYIFQNVGRCRFSPVMATVSCLCCCCASACRRLHLLLGHHRLFSANLCLAFPFISGLMRLWRRRTSNITPVVPRRTLWKLPRLVCACPVWVPFGFARNSRFVRLAALGIESVAAQHVDTLQLKVLGIHQTCHGKREVGKIHNICKRYLVALISSDISNIN